MGIKCAHSATYSITELSLVELFAISKQRSIECHAGNVPPPFPTIDIDASWVVRSKTSVSTWLKVSY